MTWPEPTQSGCLDQALLFGRWDWWTAGQLAAILGRSN